MKLMVKNKMDEEDRYAILGLDYTPGYFRDCPIGVIHIIGFLVVFVFGLMLGFAGSAHMNGYWTRNDFFSPPRFLDRSPPPPLLEVKFEEDCGSLDNFIKPKSLSHSMTDKELLWRASVVPGREELPFKRVPKVAFLFLTRGPLPLLPLWEKFFKGHEDMYSIYVHTLPNYYFNVTDDSAFYGRQIPSQEVQWGSINMVDAERRLLANALLDFSNERFVLLSESCIPVYNFPTVYKYLVSSKYSYVETYDDPSRYGRGRYSRRMSPEIRLPQWRKGSQWFEVHRELAIRIVSDSKYFSLFRKFCKPSCYPDEHYLPTYIHMFHGSLNSNRSLTWVDWSRGGPHPASFGRLDITEDFLISVRNNGTGCALHSEFNSTCHLFARKFAPSSLPRLLRYSSTVMDF